MENFFYEDRFCSDLSDILDICDIDEENLVNFDENWSIEIEEANLEPLFQLDADELCENICGSNEDRFSEDGDEKEDITKALKQCVDFEKLNSMIPSLWYPNGKTITVTKKDLIEFCN